MNYTLTEDGRSIRPPAYGPILTPDEADRHIIKMESEIASLRTLAAQARANEAAYRVHMEADIQAAVAAGATRIGNAAVVPDMMSGFRCWRRVAGEKFNDKDIEHPISWGRAFCGRTGHLARYFDWRSLCGDEMRANIAAASKNKPCKKCREVALARGLDIPPFPGEAP